MKKSAVNRRPFIQTGLGGASAWAALPGLLKTRAAASAGPLDERPQERPKGRAKIKFAVIGINHDHIHSQIEAVRRGGGEMVSFYAKAPDLVAAFTKRYPEARLARGEREILEDGTVQLVVSAAIPDERAPLGIRVMRHGKDYMSDKPGVTSH